MTSPLTKSDLCWVLVKLAGAYLIYLGLSGLFSAFISWNSLKENLDLLSSSRRGSLLAPIKLMVAGSLLPLAVGAYLLKSGMLLYQALMSVPIPQPGEGNGRELAPGIVLDDHEIEAFHSWLEKNPGFQERPLVDQIALFRDAWGRGPKP